MKQYAARGPVPQYASSVSNRDVARHIGVRIDGQDAGHTVVSYSVKEGWARIGKSGRIGNVIVKGKIEPYWRD